MAKIALVNGAASGVQALQNTTRYFPLGIGYLTPKATEADAKVPIRAAGVLSNLTARIFNNTVTATSTITSRKNGAAGNQSLSIAASTNGEFTDSSNTDTIAAGDQINIRLVTGVGGNRLNVSCLGVAFAATTDSSIRYNVGGGAVNLTTNSVSNFMPLGGLYADSATEAPTKVTFRGAGTLKNGYVNVNTNTRSTTCTFKSRKNGADGNISISISGAATGIIEDTSNTDTIASGDQVNLVVATSTGSGNLNLQCGVEFVPDNAIGTYPLVNGSDALLIVAAGATTYYSLGGTLLGSATESDTQIQTNIAWIAKNLFCYVTTNVVVSGNTTVFLRKGASNGSSTISIPATNTGYFEDTTNTDAVATTDEMNYSLTGGTGGATTFALVGIHVRYPITFNETAAASAAATDGLSPVATFNASISDSAAATDAMTGAATFNTTTSASAAAAESLAVAATFNPAVTESAAGGDSASAAATFNAPVSASAAAGDSATAAATFNTSFTDTAAATESLTAAATFNVTLTVSAAATDAVAASATFNDSIAASIAAGDSLAAVATFNTLLTELASATDAQVPGLIISTSLLESIAATDSVLAAALYSATVIETASAADAMAVVVQFNATIAAAVAASDSVVALVPSVFTPPSRILIPLRQIRILNPKEQERVL